MEIVFFMTPPGENGRAGDAGRKRVLDQPAMKPARWLDEGVVYVVSPLDAENKAEIELTEYHEAFLAVARHARRAARATLA